MCVPGGPNRILVYLEYINVLREDINITESNDSVIQDNKLTGSQINVHKTEDVNRCRPN